MPTFSKTRRGVSATHHNGRNPIKRGTSLKGNRLAVEDPAASSTIRKFHGLEIAVPLADGLGAGPTTRNSIFNRSHHDEWAYHSTIADFHAELRGESSCATSGARAYKEDYDDPKFSGIPPPPRASSHEECSSDLSSRNIESQLEGDSEDNSLSMTWCKCTGL